MKAILSKKTRLETKALFSKIMLNVYVDKEPRSIIQKPSLVRVFREPKDDASSLLGIVKFITCF